MTAEVHDKEPTEEEPKGEEPGEGATGGDYPLEDDNEEEEEDDEEEEEEDLQDPDFNAMIEEGVKRGHI